MAERLGEVLDAVAPPHLDLAVPVVEDLDTQRLQPVDDRQHPIAILLGERRGDVELILGHGIQSTALDILGDDIEKALAAELVTIAKPEADVPALERLASPTVSGARVDLPP
ncbi:hypothetical protein GCM10027200_02940 [Lentzea nigeriaca]